MSQKIKEDDFTKFCSSCTKANYFSDKAPNKFLCAHCKSMNPPAVVPSQKSKKESKDSRGQTKAFLSEGMIANCQWFFISAIVGIFIWTLFAILVAAIGRNSGSELISVIFTLIAFLGAFHAMEIIPDAPSKYDYAEKFELILFSVFIIFGPAIGGITAYYLFWK